MSDHAATSHGLLSSLRSASRPASSSSRTETWNSNASEKVPSLIESNAVPRCVYGSVPSNLQPQAPEMSFDNLQDRLLIRERAITLGSDVINHLRVDLILSASNRRSLIFSKIDIVPRIQDFSRFCHEI
jgi:hypothetical protein